MTVPLWACTGGYEIGPDRVIWTAEGPRIDLAGVAGMHGLQPWFQPMVDEDLYGHEIGFRCHGRRDGEPLPVMQGGDLYG